MSGSDTSGSDTSGSDTSGSDTSTGTAFWIAAVRAREEQRPDRLFGDPFARELAGERGFAAMAASERAGGGENPYLPVRVRWFDDLVTATAPLVAQVVALGAGLDTRPYRLDVPAELDWYELDRAELFAAKEPVLAGHAPRCRRHVVPGEVDSLATVLPTGFDPDASTLWLAEGLFFYLTEPMIAALLHTALRMCGAGSVFAADVNPTVGLDSPAMARYRDRCAAHGVPPPFGTDDPVGLFTGAGWRVGHVTAPGAADANHGRLRRQPDGFVPGRIHFVTASP